MKCYRMDCFGLGMSGEMMNFTIVVFVSEVCIVYQGESSLLSPYPSARTLPKIFRCKKGTCVTKILWKILRIITRGFGPFYPAPKLMLLNAAMKKAFAIILLLENLRFRTKLTPQLFQSFLFRANRARLSVRETQLCFRGAWGPFFLRGMLPLLLRMSALQQ